MVNTTKLNVAGMTDVQNKERALCVKYVQYVMTLEDIQSKIDTREKRLKNVTDEAVINGLNSEIATLKQEKDATEKDAQAIIENYKKVVKALEKAGNSEKVVNNFLRVLASCDNTKLTKYALKDFMTVEMYKDFQSIHNFDRAGVNGAHMNTKKDKELYSQAVGRIEKAYRENLSVKACEYFPAINIKLNKQALFALHECFVTSCANTFKNTKIKDSDDTILEYKGFELKYSASLSQKKDGTLVLKAGKFNTTCAQIAIDRILG